MTAKNSYAKGAAKREEILRVTLEIFGREGERNTTLRAVAAESGISLTGLMHYFDSKDHLLTEVLRASDRAAKIRFYSPDTVQNPGEFLAQALTATAANAARARLYVTWRPPPRTRLTRRTPTSRNASTCCERPSPSTWPPRRTKAASAPLSIRTSPPPHSSPRPTASCSSG